MGRRNSFDVPAGWLDAYTAKKKNPKPKSQPQASSVKLDAFWVIKAQSENPHRKALNSLAKNPDREKGRGEHYEQVRIFDYFFNVPTVYPFLYAIPNGGYRDDSTANALKAEGLKRGVPDMALDLPLNGYHGMKVELKAGKGKPKPEQIEKLNLFSDKGYYCVLCYGSAEAIEAINQYVLLPAGQSLAAHKNDHLWKRKAA